MKIKNIITGAVFTASSLFALDSVGTISSSTHTLGGIATNNPNITFGWSKPDGATKYCYILDTNNSTSATYVFNDTYPNCGDNPNHVSINSGDTTTKSVTVNSSGNYYLHIAAFNDTESSSTVVNTSPVAIDIDAGTVTMSPSGGSITTDNNSITLSKSETGTIYYTVDGSTPTTSSSVYTTPLTIGVSATVKAILKDTAGNEGAVNSKSFTITNNPTIKTLAGASVNGTTIATSTTNGATAVEVLDIGGVDLTRYKYKLDSATTYTTVNDMTTNVDISSLESGSHTLKVQGGDAYNFQTTDTTVTFTVDNTAPTGLTINYDGNSTVTTVNPANKTNSSTIMTLSATDSTAIKYELVAAGVSCPTSYVDFDNTYSSGFSLGSSLVDAQQVKVCMAARDSVGNVAKTNKTYTIDKSAPSITLSPSVDTVFSDTQTVTLSSTDSGAKLYYKLTDTNTAPSTSSMSEWTQDGSVTVSTTKYIHAVAVDSVGNIGTVSTIKLTKQSNATILSASDTVNIGSATTNSGISKTITISNSGTENITLSDANITVSGAGFSRSSTTCTTTLVAAATCNVTVDFNSTVIGDYNGTLSIAYDGTNESELNVSLTATVVNTAPQATYNSTIVVNEDETNTTILTGSDIDGDTITYSVGTTTSHGTLLIATDGNITYTPTENYNGSDSFTYFVNDGDLNSSELNVSITILPINDSPSILGTTLRSLTLVEDNGTTNYDLNVSDLEGYDLNISVESNDTSILTVSPNWDGLVSQANWTDSLDFNITTVENANGIAKITIMVHDGDLNTTESFDINVTAVNDAPVLGTLDPQNKQEDFADFNITLTATDVENDNLTYSVESNNTNIATATITADILTLSAVENASGFVAIDVNVTDGNKTTNSSFILTVAEQNDPPLVQNISDINISEDGTVSIIEIDATDTENTNLSYSISSSDISIASVNVTEDGNISIVPEPNRHGEVTIDLNVTDGTDTVTKSFTLNIQSVDDKPVIETIEDIEKSEDDEPFYVIASGSDVDGDTISYSVTSSDDGIATAIIAQDGNITITPVENKYGDINITVTVTANSVDVNETFKVSIVSVNDEPIINTKLNPLRYSVGAVETKSLDINATDVEDINLTYDVNSSNSSIATVSITDTNLTVTTIEDATGTATITLSVTDDDNATVSKTFTVTLKDTNITFGRDASTVEIDGGIKTTFDSLSDDGKSLELTEKDDGKIAATLDGDNDITLNIQVTGADVSVDENGSITTSLTDNGAEKEIKVKADGTVENKLTKDGKTTQVNVSVSEDVNTTVNSDGTMETSFTKSSKAVKLKVSNDGTITPTVPGNALPKSALPVGTTTTVDNDGIKFSFELPSKLEF